VASVVHPFDDVDQLGPQLVQKSHLDRLLALLDLSKNYQSLSDQLRELARTRIDDEYGLEIPQLHIVNISLPAEVEKALDARTGMGVIGDMARFQAAPQETLKLALAGIAKKRLVQEQVAGWAAQLARFACPSEIAALRDELLYAPDRNKPETRAFEQACRETGLAPARLFERCGLLPDAHEYHLNRFLHEFFPRGTRFPAYAVPALSGDLPLAGMYQGARTLRLADGPDEVHKILIAKNVLKHYHNGESWDFAN